MSFFAPRSGLGSRRPPADPPVEPPHEYLGGVLPLSLVLARSTTDDELVVCLKQLIAYPTGFDVTVNLRRRRIQAGRARRGLNDPVGGGPGGRGSTGSGPLLFGFHYADGTKLTTDRFGEADRAKGLWPRGAGGSPDHYYDRRYWAWPLPPPGDVIVACEWAAHGVPFTSVVLDAEVLRSAAARSIRLWEG